VFAGSQVPLDEVKAAFAANVFGLLDMVQVSASHHSIARGSHTTVPDNYLRHRVMEQCVSEVMDVVQMLFIILLQITACSFLAAVAVDRRAIGLLDMLSVRWG
jgi:hypothetical protein